MNPVMRNPDSCIEKTGEAGGGYTQKVLQGETGPGPWRVIWL